MSEKEKLAEKVKKDRELYNIGELAAIHILLYDIARGIKATVGLFGVIALLLSVLAILSGLQ
jgi:hypothetical protein